MGLFLNQNDFLPRVVNHDRPDKEGTYGNMSAKVDNGFYMTCRNVDKSKLKKSDLSFIENVEMVSEGSVYSKVYYNSNIKLYAKWKANTYKVKYNGNGNSSGKMSNSSHTYGCLYLGL